MIDRIVYEPKKTVAIALLVYIAISAVFIIDNFSKVNNIPKDITGLSSNGYVSIMINPRCSVNLVDGYNLISLCANLTNNSVSNVLQTINGQYDFVLKWNASNQQFVTYSPDAATNDFNTMIENESYFVFMNSNSTLRMNGAVVDDINISNIQEFNGIGYPYQFSANVSRYMLPLNSSLSFALKWNTSAQEFITFSVEAADNQFDILNQGEGQLIYAVSPVVLRYNKTLIQS